MAVVLFAIAIVAVIFHFVLGGDGTFLSRLIVVGGLAAPAGSNDKIALPGLEYSADIVDHVLVAKSLFDIFDFDHN